MRGMLVGAAIGVLLLPGMANAQEPQPGPEHQRLGFFVGAWKADAAFNASPLRPAGNEVWTLKFEWFPGKFHLVCHAELAGSSGKTAELGFMGYDSDKRLYFFDRITSEGLKVDLRAPAERGVWRFAGELPSGGKPVGLRVVFTEESATAFKYTVEVSVVEGTWVLAAEVRATKVQ